jgi:hypothetical protein
VPADITRLTTASVKALGIQTRVLPEAWRSSWMYGSADNVAEALTKTIITPRQTTNRLAQRRADGDPAGEGSPADRA